MYRRGNTREGIGRASGEQRSNDVYNRCSKIVIAKEA